MTRLFAVMDAAIEEPVQRISCCNGQNGGLNTYRRYYRS